MHEEQGPGDVSTRLSQALPPLSFPLQSFFLSGLVRAVERFDFVVGMSRRCLCDTENKKTLALL